MISPHDTAIRGGAAPARRACVARGARRIAGVAEAASGGRLRGTARHDRVDATAAEGSRGERAARRGARGTPVVRGKTAGASPPSGGFREPPSSPSIAAGGAQ